MDQTLIKMLAGILPLDWTENKVKALHRLVSNTRAGHDSDATESLEEPV